jgi:hypothetical protein
VPSRFKAAWIKFAADPARLTEFLDIKRKRPAMNQAYPARIAAGNVPGIGAQPFSEISSDEAAWMAR